MTPQETKKLIDLLNEISSTQKESLKFQKLVAKSTIKPLLEKILDKKEKRVVYDLTNGDLNRDQIVKMSGSGAGTISGWWIEWFSAGILEKNGSKYKKLFELSEFDMNVKVKTPTTEVQQVSTSSEQGEVQNG